MALRDRRPVKPAPPDPRVRYELWGFRPGQPVTLLPAPEGVPGESRYAKWKFRSVRVDDQGAPFEVDVFGGAPGYETIRTFPIERLAPPPVPKKLRKRA